VKDKKPKKKLHTEQEPEVPHVKNLAREIVEPEDKANSNTSVSGKL
jgi:hypothetical protein